MNLSAGCPGLRVYRGENSLLDYDYNSFLTRLLAFGNTVDVEVNDFYAKKLFAQTRSNSTGQTVIYAKTETKVIVLGYNKSKGFIKIEPGPYATVDGDGDVGFAQLFYTHAYMPFTKEQRGNHLLLARCPWFIKMFRLTAQGRNNALEIACAKGDSDTHSELIVPKYNNSSSPKQWKDVKDDMKQARTNAAETGLLIWWQQAVLEEVFIPEIARNLIAPNQVVQAYINGRSFHEYKEYLQAFGTTETEDMEKTIIDLANQVAHYKEDTKMWIPIGVINATNKTITIEPPKPSAKYAYLKQLICRDPNDANTTAEKIMEDIVKSHLRSNNNKKIIELVLKDEKFNQNTIDTALYSAQPDGLKSDYISLIVSAEHQHTRHMSTIAHMGHTMDLMESIDGRGTTTAGPGGGGTTAATTKKTNLGLLAMAEGYRNEVDLANKFMPVYDPYTGCDSVAWDKSMSVLITTTESLPRKREDILKSTELGKACSGIVAPVVKTTMSIPQTTGSVSLRTIGDIPNSSAGSLLQLDISKYADRGLNLLRQLPVSSANRILWSIVKQTAQRNCEDRIVLPGASGSTIPILPAAVVHTVLTDTARLMWISSRRDNSIYVISPNWQLSNTKKSPGYDKQKLQNAVDVHFAKQNGLMPGCFNFSNIIFSFTELMAESCNESCRDAMYGSNDLSMCRIPAIDPRSVRAYQLRYGVDTLHRHSTQFGGPGAANNTRRRAAQVGGGGGAKIEEVKHSSSDKEVTGDEKSSYELQEEEM